MLRKPVFKCCFEVEILRDRVVVFNEMESYYTLEGEAYVLLAPFLLSRVSTDKIVESLGEKISAAEVYYALMHLEQKGLIEEASDVLNQSLRSFCHLLGVPLKEAARRIETTVLSLRGIGQVDPKILEEKLRAFSLKVETEGNFAVVLTDHYRRKELEPFHLASLKTGKPWLLIKPVGIEPWVGPLFIPKQTGCFHCLLERLEKNQVEEKWVEIHGKRKVPLSANFSSPPMSEEIACNLAANEIFKWVVLDENLDVEGKVISYHQLDRKMESHVLFKNPHCPSCGKRRLRCKPFIPQSQKVNFSADGGYRTVCPEETFEKYRCHISPITGVIRSLSKRVIPNTSLETYYASHLMGNLKKGIPHLYREGLKNRELSKEAPQTFLAGARGIAKGKTRSEDEKFEAKPTPEKTDFSITSGINCFRDTSVGKGFTESQSKASCLGEALERYSGNLLGGEVRRRGSYQQLKGEAIDPRSCLLFSERQYRSRITRNRETLLSRYRIPAPFEEKREIDWTPVWSLTEQRWKWLPTAFCFLDIVSREEEGFCMGNSNGCASGNTKEEAFLHGFFELVERDSIAIWWYNKLQMPAVDLQSFQNPYFSSLLSIYAKQKREVWMLDLTMDIPVPTFAAISRRIDSKEERIAIGFGAHLDPRIAASRALSEMNQILTSFSSLSERKDSEENRFLKRWFQEVTLQKNPYLAPSFVHRFDKKGSCPNDLKDAVLFCQRLAEEKGLEVLVLDQTRAEIGLPVVRVIVPGLRHFRNRFAEGRLYDVPVQLGFLKRKLKEEELNSQLFF